MNDDKKTDADRLEAVTESFELLVGFSSEALPRIVAVAKLALLALESPRGAGDMEMIAQALLTIKALASDLAVEVENEASAAGIAELTRMSSRGLIARYKAQAAVLGLTTAITAKDAQ
jgi:hypothetical protein